MRYHIVAMALVGLLLGTVLLACGQDTPLGQKVATTACVTCHSNLITCTNLDKDREYWEKTVQRMADKGMDISGEEQQAVVDYLSDLEPGSKPVCD
jgi:cytochrome c5